MINESIEDKQLMEYYTNELEKFFNFFVNDITRSSRLKAFDGQAYKNLTDEEYENDYEENEILFDKLKNIKFSYAKHDKWGGWASYKNKEIVISANNVLRITKIIIHEFTHHLIYILSNGDKTGHTLEFAIMNYCLLNRHQKNTWNKDCGLKSHEETLFNYDNTFFRSYDIHEDPAYSLLSINVCKFDTLIKNIQFETLQDLYNKSCKYAEKIRNKAIEI